MKRVISNHERRRLAAQRYLGLTALALGLIPLCPGSAMGGQSLKGHFLPQAAPSLKVRPMADSTRIRLVIGLPLRDPAGLQALLSGLYDPHSPLYRRFLTPGEFTERFGPTPGDYQRVLQFTQSQGLQVEGTHPNRLLLDVSGTAANVEKVFHVHLDYYRRPDGSLFYAPEREPSVDLDVPLRHVSGLDNYHRPRPKLRRGKTRGPQSGTSRNSGCRGCYQGGDFRDAYAPNLPATVNGAGQSVALLEFDGFFQSDISNYESSSNPSFTAPRPVTVLVDGANGVPSSAGVTNGNDDEVSLDIEMVASMAPGAQVVVYEVPPAIFNDGTQVQYDGAADDMLSRMATDHTCNQISSSWGGYGDGNTPGILSELAAQGQAYFEASGDFGSYVSNGFPGDACTAPNNSVTDDPSLYQSQYETLVGGTAVTTTPNTGNPPITFVSETTWNDRYLAGSTCDGDGNAASSGGICSDPGTIYLAIPAYQTPVPMGTNGGSTSARNFPDVSACATNLFLYSEEGGYQGPEEGTSAASPLWAAYWALANQEAQAQGKVPIGSANPALYPIGLGPDYTSDFHDINDGSTNFYYWPSSSGPYTAVSGFDLATGWGSPRGQSLVNDLVSTLATFTPTPTPTATDTPCGYPGNTCTFTPTPTPVPAFSAQAWPNVTNGQLPIRFMVTLPSPASIQLSIYDVAQELLYSTTVPGVEGSNSLTWPVQNQSGIPLSNGLYIYTVRSGGNKKIGKVEVFR